MPLSEELKDKLLQNDPMFWPKPPRSEERLMKIEEFQIVRTLYRETGKRVPSNPNLYRMNGEYVSKSEFFAHIRELENERETK